MREKLLWLAAVFIAFLSAESQEFYAASYDNLALTTSMAVASGVLAAALFSIPVLFSALVLKDTKFTRFVSVGLLAYVLFRIFGTRLSQSLQDAGKLALIFCVVVILAVALRYLGEKNLGRFARSVIFAALAWTISIPLVALFQRSYSGEAIPVINVRNIIQDPPRAVLILVLDETSPEVAGLLTSALQDGEHEIYSGTSHRAGKDTINAIPSMLTRERHDDAVPCGREQLCGEAPFEMSRLRGAQPDTDVVGFYHPYCKIQGLRSCWRASSEQAESPANKVSIFAAALARLPLFARFVRKRDADNIQDILEYTRNSVANKALAAPFWVEGGILYVHQFLPHPTGTGSSRSLSVEYHENLRQAAAFLETLQQKLRARFANDYALIITSDHPLRVSSWCKLPTYSNGTCALDNPLEGDLVPFIVSAPKGMPVHLPVSNVGVFAD